MDPPQVSARFAAYVWFTSRHGESVQGRKESLRFADAHWREFLPCAHAGLGRLLVGIAGGSRGRQGRSGHRRGGLTLAEAAAG
jgi:hypothetical protein